MDRRRRKSCEAETGLSHRPLSNNIIPPLLRTSFSHLFNQGKYKQINISTPQIDRANIGNARIQGMSTELKLRGFKFNWALTVFYIIYIFVEVPSNVLLKRIGPKLWIPFLVAAFGAVSVGTAFVKNFNGLMVARAVLGLVEGGTMPGISFFSELLL